MDPQKSKEGVSVKEIEEFAKKHRFEVFFCLSFIFAVFFSFVFFGAGWAIVLAGLGGILGVLAASKVEFVARQIFGFIFKQEQITQMVLGIVMLIISIFLPPLIFFLIGVHGGKSLHHLAMEIASQYRR